MALTGALTLGAGGSLTSALESAAFAFASAAVFTGVGEMLGSNPNLFVKAAVHGVAGGALSVAQGGNFLQGFAANAMGALSGGLASGGELAGTYGDGIPANQIALALISGAAGCAGASVTGGKCADAAVTAAFASLYNGDGVRSNIAARNYFKFDGKQLGLYDQGVLIESWSAVSGRPGFQDPLQQGQNNMGPIPEGEYELRQSNLQQIGVIDAIVGIIGRGGWPGSVAAWGTQRIWLEPTEAMTAEGWTLGRSGFSIHGGWHPGSAGCIDMTDTMSSFSNQFRSMGISAKLYVSYPR